MAVVFSAAIRTSGWAYSNSNIDGGVGGGSEQWGRRRALDSTVHNDAVATKDTITQLAVRLLRRADRYRLRGFGVHESGGAPDEKERRPKHQPPGYQACMMAP
jgi:hypothetical protein